MLPDLTRYIVGSWLLPAAYADYMMVNDNGVVMGEFNQIGHQTTVHCSCHLPQCERQGTISAFGRIRVPSLHYNQRGGGSHENVSAVAAAADDDDCFTFGVVVPDQSISQIRASHTKSVSPLVL
jgi:hypothetical protein